ncbi:MULTISPECIES: LysR family transcriptional regulator [Pseudomonadota]
MEIMDLKHFRSFLAVANCLHFGRAAEQLGVSPPSLTKQIQDAEKALGVRLFNRTKRSVSLTAAGEIFLFESKKALEQVSLAQESARRAGRGEIGQIDIGYIASSAYSGVFQRELAEFRQRHLGIEIRPREGSLAKLTEMVETGVLDLAFVRPPVILPPSMEMVVISKERYILAVHASSRLAKLTEIQPARLSKERFIRPEQEFGTFELGRRGKFHPMFVAQPGRLVAVITMVSLGSGIALIPDSVVDCIRLPNVVYRPIADVPITTDVAVAYRRYEKEPAVRVFIEQVRAHAAALE